MKCCELKINSTSNLERERALSYCHGSMLLNTSCGVLLDHWFGRNVNWKFGPRISFSVFPHQLPSLHSWIDSSMIHMLRKPSEIFGIDWQCEGRDRRHPRTPLIDWRKLTSRALCHQVLHLRSEAFFDRRNFLVLMMDFALKGICFPIIHVLFYHFVVQSTISITPFLQVLMFFTVSLHWMRWQFKSRP